MKSEMPLDEEIALVERRLQQRAADIEHQWGMLKRKARKRNSIVLLVLAAAAAVLVVALSRRRRTAALPAPVTAPPGLMTRATTLLGLIEVLRSLPLDRILHWFSERRPPTRPALMNRLENRTSLDSVTTERPLATTVFREGSE